VAPGCKIHGDPWLRPDRVRVMQGVVVGRSGGGKTNGTLVAHRPSHYAYLGDDDDET
jgi:hypothetical protein